MVVKNYYKILDLNTSRVSIEEIRNAYRKAAKKYHPDVNVGDSLAEERIKDINEAYKVLSVPASKRKYDRMWNSHFAPKNKIFSGKEDKKVLMKMFFGSTENNNVRKVKNKTPKKGENIETQITTSIYEAFYGLDKKFSVKNVDGKIKTFSVKVPEGIHSGEKIRLIGQGKMGQDGGQNGDLIIQINVANDDKFKIKGNDLYTELFLTPWEAALGTRAEVQSIDDATTIYIPQGIQNGEKLRIPGKGYKKDKGLRGDLVAEIKIMVPKKLTEEEKNIFEKLREISNFNPRSN